MYKIIGADGKEYGPVAGEQVRQWVRDGRANAQTRIQGEGATEWTTLGAVPEFEVWDASPRTSRRWAPTARCPGT